jgi:membrane protein implicated in regulation of membrane protease activity
MTFSLPGFDQWTFQIVMFGSLLVLEALSGDQTLSTVLDPMDSTRARAHALINRPCCALVAAHAL